MKGSAMYKEGKRKQFKVMIHQAATEVINEEDEDEEAHNWKRRESQEMQLSRPHFDHLEIARSPDSPKGPGGRRYGPRLSLPAPGGSPGGDDDDDEDGTGRSGAIGFGGTRSSGSRMDYLRSPSAVSEAMCSDCSSETGSKYSGMRLDATALRCGLLGDDLRLKSSAASMCGSDVSGYTSRTKMTGAAMTSKDYTLAELATMDEPLPFRPFCEKCDPITPTELLPLRPDDVNMKAQLKRERLEQLEDMAKRTTVNQARDMAKWHSMTGTAWTKTNLEALASRTTSKEPDFDELAARHDAAMKKKGGGFGVRGAESKLQQYKKRLRKTAVEVELWQQPVSRTYNPDVEDIALADKPCKSRWSHEMVGAGKEDDSDDDLDDVFDTPAVFKRLTEIELGRLELWAKNHVKQQYIEACALAHMSSPKKTNRHKMAMTFTTVCQLLQKAKAGAMLMPDESKYMRERLVELPFMKQLPTEKFDHVVESLSVFSWVGGSLIFRQGEEIQGLHILVTGDLEMKSEAALALQMNKRKEPPHAINLEDIFDQKDARPFFMKENLVWSRSAIIPVDDDSDSLSMTLFVPRTILEDLANWYRTAEHTERDSVVGSLFAKAASLRKEECLKHRDCFEFRSLQQQSVIVSEGAKPSLDTARITLVIQGKVRVVKSRKEQAEMRKRRQNMAQNAMAGKRRRGGILAAGAKDLLADEEYYDIRKIIGTEALYGEKYSKTLVVHSTIAKIISVTARDFLNCLMNRDSFLVRADRTTKSRERIEAVEEVRERQISGATSDSETTSNSEGKIIVPRAAGKPVQKRIISEAKKMLAKTSHASQITRDKEKLLATEDWKFIRDKADLPQSKAPSFASWLEKPIGSHFSAAPLMKPSERGPQQKRMQVEQALKSSVRGHSVDGLGVADLCYPRSCDISPNMQRKTMNMLRHGIAGYCELDDLRCPSNASTQAPDSRGCTSMDFLSEEASRAVSPQQRLASARPDSKTLDIICQRIKHTEEETKRLEAEHRAHTSLGFRVHNADGQGLSERTAILLTCGAPAVPDRDGGKLPSRQGARSPAAFFAGVQQQPAGNTRARTPRLSVSLGRSAASSVNSHRASPSSDVCSARAPRIPRPQTSMA
eukprot:TRINITY_DN1119_c0_g4_i1.p1 TRINITY_DN1119_c0_g4~~TRINITY_DN1119_c0_g4_i1.p1  ORF type:complete len:1118 (-),score=296.14 TRINITY_DN1119_c0_g4_i1:86-3439(-)